MSRSALYWWTCIAFAVVWTYLGNPTASSAFLAASFVIAAQEKK